MPASTRSRTQQKQIQLDDSKELKSPIKSTKRKADARFGDGPSKKSVKRPDADAKDGARSRDNEEGSITINRAPVLELWAASVTSFLHPKLPWQTCLSVGGAISTICAISKGRAIGSIEKPDPEQAKEKHEKRRKAAEQLDEIEVMHFHLALKGGNALVSGKPRKANESALRSKFGEAYDSTLEAFASSLKAWKGQEDNLDSQAFHMYEKFRPTVPSGQKGWGRKGQLSLDKIREVVGNPVT